MDRAYSLLTLKVVNEEKRTISGMASTPTPDRMGDIVEPEGAEFKLPIPLLWQHDSRQPIGHVTRARVTKKGIEITAQLARVAEEGNLKARLDEAWQSIKAQLVRGLSIGFKALETSDIEGTFGIRFLRWEWLELSAVTIPANADASIQAIKSFDTRQRAASGHTRKGSSAPGGSGPSKQPQTEGRTTMKSIPEQISELEAERAAPAARMDEIMKQAAADNDRDLDDEEAKEFDEMSGEVAEIDTKLRRLRMLDQARNGAKAVDGGSADNGRRSRTEPRIEVKEEKLEKGIRLARVVRCIGLSHVLHRDVKELAKELYPNDPLAQKAVALAQKAAVPGASSSHSTWAGPLVGDETSAFADFVEYLRPQTILGKFGMGGIPSLRRIPFRVALISQTTGGAGYWVGEGQSKGLTKFDFSRTHLEPLKVANIAVATEEVLRDSSPSAEMIIRDQLAAALRFRLDTDFIDPGKAASANVSPASITNGLVLNTQLFAATGQDEQEIRNDVRTLFNAFVAANNPPSSGVWIMSVQTALALSLMINALGQPAFPGITMMGGTFFGLPVITSEFMPNYASSPAQFTYSYVALVNTQDIYFADEGGIAVDMSREASLNMVDTVGAQSSLSPPVEAATHVSLWQTNSVGFRAERTVNWARRRTSAVALMKDVAWGQGLTSA